MNYNRVILGGRLTRDPETRYAQSGNAVVSFGMAVNRRFKKGDEWQEEPVFVDVTLFGKRGEAFSRFHTKGAACFIEGTLKLDQWDDKNTGAKRSKICVIGDEWQFVGSKEERQAETAPSAIAETMAPSIDDDVPW